jgi:hypothetical protein
MDIKNLIINQINKMMLNEINDKHDLNYLQMLLKSDKYMIIINALDSLNITNIVNQLSIDHLCRLLIDGHLDFTIFENKIKYHETNQITLNSLYYIKEYKFKYYNLILIDK